MIFTAAYIKYIKHHGKWRYGFDFFRICRGLYFSGVRIKEGIIFWGFLVNYSLFFCNIIKCNLTQNKNKIVRDELKWGLVLPKISSLKKNKVAELLYVYVYL